MPRSTHAAASLALLAALALGSIAEAQVGPFQRGDANADGSVNIADPLYVLGALFESGRSISCNVAADANDDDRVDVSDAVYELNFLFADGRPIPPPESCDFDPTPGKLGCVIYAPCIATQPPEPGQIYFETPSAGGAFFRGGFFGADDAVDAPAAGGAPPPAPAPAEADTTESEPERTIEEADLYRIDGEHLYALNRYRGLQILDISDRDDPQLLGSAPIYGHPREMYVRGTTAYVIVSDYFDYWRAEDALTTPRGFYGSQLRVVDVSDVTAPEVIGAIDLRGDLSDSRIVGDVMYLVSNRFPWYGGYGTDDTEDKTEIISVSIGDPSSIAVIDTQDFPRNGWAHHIEVTADTIYLAASQWDQTSRRYRSTVRLIDIRDASGIIHVGGEVDVPGLVPDRWSMNEYDGVLRVASTESWGNGDVYLNTYAVSDRDRPTHLGGYTLKINERLTAARFDGSRGYLVTYRNIDPLFVFDLTDASEPRLLGELEMTGWLDFMVPLGDRIVALGHEDLVDEETGRREISLAVSLVDVSDLTKPTLLSRVTLDELWAWVPGDRDDFAKVFKTLAAQGLILFPFRGWNRETYSHSGGVQLIDLGRDELTKRGLITGGGDVQRAIPHEETTVFTLSHEMFQVVDITDRDEPELLGSVELARNVQELYVLADGEHTVQLVGNWYLGDTRLIVTTVDEPNATEPLASLKLPAPYGRLFVSGDFVYVASVRNDLVGDGHEPRTHVQVVDVSDPLAPRLRGGVTLPESIWLGFRDWYWGGGDEVVLAGESTLVFHRFEYAWWGPCFACDFIGPVAPSTTSHRMHVVDLSDPDAPEVASTIRLDDVHWAWGLRANGNEIFLTSSVSFARVDLWFDRFLLHRFDLTDPSDPVEHAPVNIPGQLVGIDSDGRTIHTLESRWLSIEARNEERLHSLRLEGENAVLLGSVVLPGTSTGVVVRDEAAFVATTRNSQIDGRWRGIAELNTVDLGDPSRPEIAATVELPAYWAFLRDVVGDHAFIGIQSGILTYDVSDIEMPDFRGFFRTEWSESIVVHDGKAYLPTGFYGVRVLDLASGGE